MKTLKSTLELKSLVSNRHVNIQVKHQVYYVARPINALLGAANAGNATEKNLKD